MGRPADSLAVLAVLGVSLAFWPTPTMAARARLSRLSRLARLGPPLAADEPEFAGQAIARRRALLFAGSAGTAVVAAVPSVAGGLIAALLSVGSYFLLNGHGRPQGERVHGRSSTWLSVLPWPGPTTGRGSPTDPRLPFAIDLLAVCLRAGMPTSVALRAVADTLTCFRAAGGGASAGDAVGPALVFARVAAASELGSEPVTAWADWVGHPVYGPIARALVVTGESGSAVAARLAGVADQLRAAAGQRATTRAQRAGVALMAPLGLCFLPAFVCLGVVPVVVGIAGQVFG